MIVGTTRHRSVMTYPLLSMLFMLIVTGSIFSQTTWEFAGTPYAYQKLHFDSATAVVQSKLGIQMHIFGAPYNQIDSTLLQVMSEDTNYKALLLGEISPTPASGQLNFSNRVFIESATGVPDFHYFDSTYNLKKSIYTDYMVMQGHPYAWTTQAKLDEFQAIVNYLIADSVMFTTPYEYYQYVTNLSIPRTNKIQVILKLDDLRAATSYFYPVLATFDLLSTKKVKAAFGVNKLEALTQSQIDTLQYYLAKTNDSAEPLFEIWNHGLDHSMTASSSGGNWSSPASWPSGYVPTAVDDVVIPAGVTITLDTTDAVCNDLLIEGSLVARNTRAAVLTVNGDIRISVGGSFTSPYHPDTAANIFHTLNVYGDFTNAGGTFDFRGGSAGNTLSAMNTTFLGSHNSTISVGTYSSSNNDFNGITINKSNGAKVICASDVVIDPGSSAGKALLTLTNGIVETGNYTLYVLSTTTADIVSASASSYISGALGRGMSNSAGKSNTFAVGDSRSYRPLSLTSTTAGTATGHHVVVRCVSSNANTGSSIFTGGIDKVSEVRYYQVSYNKGIGAGANSMSFNLFSPSYGTDDGVQVGNTDLRVAYSADDRATWNGMTQSTPHNTSLTSPPTTIIPTALGSVLTLNSGTGYIDVALSRVTGTTTNPLTNPYTLSINAVNGTVVKNPDQSTYASGATVLLTATPNSGYHFTGWSGDTTDTANPITVIMNSSKTITANFASNGYSINITALHGTVAKDPDQENYDAGTQVSLTATPATGYHFTGWSGDTTESANPITVTVNSTMNITANFAINQYGITATAGEHGSILPSGTTLVDYGTAQRYTFLANEGWKVDSVFVDGSLVDSTEGYTFVNVVTTHTIQVTFTLAQVTVQAQVQQKWNIVSVPVQTVSTLKSFLYPTSVSNAFYFQGSYISNDTMQTGRGYWLKFNDAQTVSLTGFPISTLTIDVQSGWNMIGSLTEAVPVATITSNPPGMVTGQIFGYNSQYSPTDTLYPGMGYWVKTQQAGQLMLNNTLAGLAKANQHSMIHIVASKELPPPPPIDEVVSNQLILPTEFKLGQAFPNPFNPSTIIQYELPVSGYVVLNVYNIMGKEVASLVNSTQESGYKSLSFNASNLGSGVYYYRLTIMGTEHGTVFTDVKRMVLMK